MQTIFVLLVLAISQSAFAADFTPAERLKSFPVPPGETVQQDIDLDQQPDFAFIKAHQDFAFGDPFWFERQSRKPIPDHVFEYFLSDKAPREIYLFYQLYFNQDAKKTDALRSKPYYNSRSINHFDAKNEADVPNQPDEADAVYYKFRAYGANGMILDILIFNKGDGGKTLVYLDAFDQVK